MAKYINGYLVISTGMWVHSNHPECACSPDGLALDPSMSSNKYGLIEIKCPAELEHHHPLDAQTRPFLLHCYARQIGSENKPHVQFSDADVVMNLWFDTGRLCNMDTKKNQLTTNSQ